MSVEREQYGSGAVRDTNADKGRYDLLGDFAPAMRRLAKVAQQGGLDYGDHNWTKGLGTPEGMPWSRFIDSAMRHLFAAAGNYQYPGSKQTDDHLAQATWNLMAAMTEEHWRTVHQQQQQEPLTDAP